MNIGIPKESRPSEKRVGLPPAGVRMLVNREHTCYIEHNAGLDVGYTDQDYEKAGGKIVYSAHEAFARADMVLKFSRPQENELEMLQSGAVVAGFLHMASASHAKIDSLLENKITTVAYEQVRHEDDLPILRTMSEVGGRLVPQIAAQLLQNNVGGKGILMGGIPGVPPAEIVIIGAGIFGYFATKTFLGMGAQVTVLDRSPNALQRIHHDHPQAVTMFATSANIARTCAYADVVITAAAVTGEPAPKLVTREILRKMKRRAIIMDTSVDQGGCVETSRPTTIENPTFIEEGVVHYCVPNMSSVIARTATNAFFNAAMPYIIEIANKGVEQAMQDNPAIANAVNTHQGALHNLKRLTPKEA